MSKKDDHIRIDKKEYWKLREQHEQLAKESGHARHLVLCAKERLNNVVTEVMRDDRPKSLCYVEDQKHISVARRLLAEAEEMNRKYLDESQ